MAPKKRTTRASPATTTTTTTPVTNAQLKALIDQGAADALAARDADKSRNSEDNHDSRTGELALMSARMFLEESDKIERYVSGLPDMIHEIVMDSKPKTIQDAQVTRGRTLAGPTLLGLGRRSHMGYLSHYALNATITMMVRVLPNATGATELAIWTVTVGVLLLLTIRETSLAMNMGIKGTTGVIS
nr:hypothetical protein [Tanacetum cinerariifolium]